MITLNTGAYIAEIVRSGIHAIDPGQRGSRPDSVYGRWSHCGGCASGRIF